MKRINVIALVLLSLLVISCGTKITLKERVDTIPRELALDYLQNESGKYASTKQCIYTNYGVAGTPYSDLVWERSAWNLPELWLLKIGEGTNMLDQSAVVCFSVLHDIRTTNFTKEEWEEAMNKTVAALESLGVQEKSKYEKK